jgi:hypothetical protein
MRFKSGKSSQSPDEGDTRFYAVEGEAKSQPDFIRAAHGELIVDCELRRIVQLTGITRLELTAASAYASYRT